MSFSSPSDDIPYSAPYSDAPPSPAMNPGSPPGDMVASPEMQAWLEQLQRQAHRLGLQNRALTGAVALGVFAAIVAIWGLYRATFGAYAALDGLTAEQNPASPGRIDFSFHVASPGRVFYQRSSGGRVSEMIDHFHTTGDLTRAWSWDYSPGEDIFVTAWYRSWFVRRSRIWRFPTSNRLDVVMLIDTTQSMGPNIQHLKTQCTQFSERISKQGWQLRYAVMAFGSRETKPWLYRQDPTDDMLEFIVAVDQMPRFPDGPTLGSALDALEEAIDMPFQEGSARRCFLVTDNGYHGTTGRGATVAMLAERLAQKRIRLDVFSLPEWRADYELLLGTAGRFYPLERFGQLMPQGQILED